MEDMKPKKYSSHSHNINNSLKETNSSIFPSFSSIIEEITNIFKSDDDTKKNSSIKSNNINLYKKKTQYCNCKITHSEDYCDNIYSILQTLKHGIDNKNSKTLYENLLKVNEKTLDINGENLRQINKDLNRTYPSTYIFKDDRILHKLKNVLRAFSNYDNTIKYFQGMNFIVGFFLYHCNEYIAFWLFVALIEEYDLRRIFMKDFPGLKLHVKRIEFVLQNDYKNLWIIFQKLGVKVEIFMVEWVFSLFSSLIPLELQMDFYKGFVSQGWIFFYKMCISSILNLNGGFFEVDEIYMALKCGKNEGKAKEKDVWDKWKKIIQNAYTLKIKSDIMSVNM